MQKIDLFGDKTNQGHNYAMYRPKYPVEFLNKINSQKYNNYIDFACGSG